jgi:hypothetical protein
MIHGCFDHIQHNGKEICIPMCGLNNSQSNHTCTMDMEFVDCPDCLKKMAQCETCPDPMNCLDSDGCFQLMEEAQNWFKSTNKGGEANV